VCVSVCVCVCVCSYIIHTHTHTHTHTYIYTYIYIYIYMYTYRYTYIHTSKDDEVSDLKHTGARRGRGHRITNLQRWKQMETVLDRGRQEELERARREREVDRCVTVYKKLCSLCRMCSLN